MARMSSPPWIGSLSDRAGRRIFLLTMANFLSARRLYFGAYQHEVRSDLSRPGKPPRLRAGSLD